MIRFRDATGLAVEVYAVECDGRMHSPEEIAAALAPPAEVVLSQGRHWLMVRGLGLAMETDMCRDPDIAVRYWTRDALCQARDLINRARERRR